MTKYHLTWSSKHKAVRRVEQAAYVILMPTLTPHYASSDRASHRYFHSFIQPVWHGAFMVWQFFTRRIFASAQRFRISARAQRFRISATIGLNAYVFLRLLTAIVCCICSTETCAYLRLLQYPHPRKHARCEHHAGINGCDLEILTS
jgi:hypothetical protein